MGVDGLGSAACGVLTFGVALMGVAALGVAEFGVVALGVADLSVTSFGVVVLGVALFGVALFAEDFVEDFAEADFDPASLGVAGFCGVSTLWGLGTFCGVAAARVGVLRSCFSKVGEIALSCNWASSWRFISLSGVLTLRGPGDGTGTVRLAHTFSSKAGSSG